MWIAVIPLVTASISFIVLDSIPDFERGGICQGLIPDKGWPFLIYNNFVDSVAEIEAYSAVQCVSGSVIKRLDILSFLKALRSDAASIAFLTQNKRRAWFPWSNSNSDLYYVSASGELGKAARNLDPVEKSWCMSKSYAASILALAFSYNYLHLLSIICIYHMQQVVWLLPTISTSQ